MSPALNGSSGLERFECSNAIEIRNRIMFDFYPGLPHAGSVGFIYGFMVNNHPTRRVEPEVFNKYQTTNALRVIFSNLIGPGCYE